MPKNKKKNKQNRNVKIFSKSTDDEIFSLCNKQTKKEDMQVKPAGSFCSLVKSFCKSENCNTCKALQNHVPNKEWLCTKCANAELYKLLPYWSAVICTRCGWENGVMVCAKLKKVRR